MIAFGNTNRGVVRPNNEDNYAVQLIPEADAALLVVCDGMGGANAGNVASRAAIDKFMQVVKPEICSDMSVTQIEDALRVGAQSANRAVFEMSKTQPELHGMGTTLVAALVQGHHAVVINVGDSRAYLLRSGLVSQITEDHSFVQEMVRKGKMTQEESRVHPHKNLITRAIGVDTFVDSDLFYHSLEEKDILLLCSDGLTGMVEDVQIARIADDAKTLEQAVNELIAHACKNGGMDNITVVLFRRSGQADKE